ncbi:RNA polymerase sigma factor [Maricaulis sp.]|uniref:RNA polymerase sigma factor n=1 Tax=Maricaulis sp. TaxID=1486257 RepID=UPI00262C776F|nr:RNA polymerase sigma factor [Maricaulis sp.]
MSQTPTDAALVAAARSGSDAAFGRLVDRHQQDLRRFVRRLCPVSSEADDIAQEALLSAWSRLRTLRDGARFKTWLFSIAWNTVRSTSRSAVRRRDRDTRWQSEQDEASDPQHERHIALQQALSELSEEQRAAVALCLAGGWSHAEAAQILSMPLGTLKSHVTRGRARLEAILGVSHD